MSDSLCIELDLLEQEWLLEASEEEDDVKYMGSDVDDFDACLEPVKGVNFKEVLEELPKPFIGEEILHKRVIDVMSFDEFLVLLSVLRARLLVDVEAFNDDCVSVFKHESVECSDDILNEI